MSLNGQLNVMLHLVKQDNCQIIKDVDIDLARPNVAQKMLVGQSPQHAIERISQLMTICQHAQTAAAKLALGKQLCSKEIKSIAYENIEQGFWRLVIDLPNTLGIKFPLDNFIELRKAIAKQNHDNITMFAQQLFIQLCQYNSQKFAELTTEQFLHWLEVANSPMSSALKQIKPDNLLNTNSNKKYNPMLSSIPDEALLKEINESLLNQECFHHIPHINGKSHETGSLSTLLSHPLAPLFADMGIAGRIASRLLYIAQKINELKHNNAKAAIFGTYSTQAHKQNNTQGEGQLAWVQTARGLLIHLANIQQGKISQYSIIAPTEWNFHPEGSLTKMLINSSFHSQYTAKKSAKLAVIALDPCIEFNLGVAYA